MSFENIEIHRIMLQDERRTRAYERAIEEIVRPNHRVLDYPDLKPV